MDPWGLLNEIDFLRTDRSDTDLYQGQPILHHTGHHTRMAVWIVLVGLAEIAMGVDLHHTHTRIIPGMRPNRP